MVVYVLMLSVEYEGDNLIDVFADYDEAKEVCESLNNTKPAKDYMYYIERKAVIGSI